MIRQHLSQNKFQLGKVKDDFLLYFPIQFSENALNYDTYIIWTLLKNDLMPLNVNCYRLFKLSVNDLHSPTIRCLLNVNRLPISFNAWTIFCSAMLPLDELLLDKQPRRLTYFVFYTAKTIDSATVKEPGSYYRNYFLELWTAASNIFFPISRERSWSRFNRLLLDKGMVTWSRKKPRLKRLSYSKREKLKPLEPLFMRDVIHHSPESLESREMLTIS